MKIVDTGVKWGYGTHDIFGPWGVQLFSVMSLADLDKYLENNRPDIVLFGGGLDINPKIYHHENVASGCDGPEICRRDLYERTIWQTIKKLGIPSLGICRGAQLTCALSGGALYQDVSGHTSTHDIMFEDGSVMPITSTHHQMMLPFLTKHKVIAWSAERRSHRYLIDVKSKEAKEHKQPLTEPEIVFFPDTKALAVQGHPEYWDARNATVRKIRQIVNEFLLNGAMPNV